MEIIVADGGSSDGTMEIAVALADKVTGAVGDNIDCIARGRNNGATRASGKVLIFVNADVLFKNINHFFNYLESYFLKSEYAAFTTKVRIFPDEENFGDKIFHSFYNYYFFLFNLLTYGMGRGECQVVKKEYFKRVGGYNENLIAGEDFDLFKRLKKYGKIKFELNLTVFESPRRFRKYGYFKITSEWFKNAVAIIAKNRSISKVWEQVR